MSVTEQLEKLNKEKKKMKPGFSVPKSYAICLCAILAGLALSACGAKPPEAPKPKAPEPTMIVEVEKVPVATPQPAATPPEAPAEVEVEVETEAVPVAYRGERKIIKHAELDLLVTDTDVAIDRVTGLAVEYGGYIISSRTWYSDEFKYATVTMGVPVGSFEEVMRRLRTLAVKVENEMASGKDVTDEYVDLESQLRNLEATEARIRSFLDKAKTVEEALQVNKQLSEIQRQIEEIKGRMNYLKDRAAFSTITINLDPQRPTPTPTPTLTPTPTPTLTPTPTPWNPGETFTEASGVLVTIVKFLVDALIWLSVLFLPFIAPLIVLAWLVNRWRKRRKGKTDKADSE